MNPWVVVHAKFAGDSKADVGDQIYSIKAFQAEGSLKIGWYF